MNNFLDRFIHFCGLNNKYIDALFLSIIICLSFIPYISGLGFYSDDWAWLGNMKFTSDQSILGVFKSNYSEFVKMRPGQILYFSFLYWLGGMAPIKYHLVNSFVFITGAILFYLILRNLLADRFLSISIAVLFSLLPHYSTDRFWMSAYPIVLSMTLYFLSLYSDLKSLENNRAKIILWKILSIICLVFSTLTYEIFLPLFFINPILVFYKKRKSSILSNGNKLIDSKLVILCSINLIALILVLIFKAITTVRIGDLGGILNQSIWFVELMMGAVKISYFTYGLELPLIIFSILRKNIDIATIILTFIVCLLIFVYIKSIINKRKTLNKNQMFKLILIGGIMFVIGYAIFLTNRNAGITAAGMNNRIALASTMGIAISFVGLVGYIFSFDYFIKFRNNLFCFSISILCATGFFINSSLSSYWVSAYKKEGGIMRDIKQTIPDLPSNSTVIFDGICPFMGPASVFEGHHDVTGFLKLLYKDTTLKGDIVTDNFKVGINSFETTIYGFKFVYPYGDLLYLFNHKDNQVHIIREHSEALNYFNSTTVNNNILCPNSAPGYGVRVF